MIISIGMLKDPGSLSPQKRTGDTVQLVKHLPWMQLTWVGPWHAIWFPEHAKSDSCMQNQKQYLTSIGGASQAPQRK